MLWKPKTMLVIHQSGDRGDVTLSHDVREQVLKNKLKNFINPLPDMPILGSSNSAANKDMV